MKNFIGDFIYNIARPKTEQEMELEKRERWLRKEKNKENRRKFIKNLFSNMFASLKDLLRKKTPEEKRVLKREKSIARAIKKKEKKEKFKEYISSIRTKLSNKKEDKHELVIVDNNQEYNFEKFEKLVQEVKESKKIEKEEQPKDIINKTSNILKKPNFILVKEYKEKTWEDKEFEKLKRNIKFETSINKFKEVRLERINKLKRKLNIQPRVVDKKIDTNYTNYVSNLKISKIFIGSILASGATIALSKISLPSNFKDMSLIATSLNLGLYNLIDGIYLKLPQYQKIKKFEL